MVYSKHFNFMKKLFLPLFFTAMFLIFIPQKSHAKNWMIIQGTEVMAKKKGKKAPFVEFWGFVQPQFVWQGNGPYAPLKGKGSDKGQYSFQILRARIGARGSLTDRINFFFLTEFGDNGLTRKKDGTTGARAFPVPALTDATATVRLFKNYIFIRVGQYKLNFGTDGFQGIPAWIYVNSSMAAHMLLNQPDRNYGIESGAAAIQGYRDIGAQVLGLIPVGPGQIGYAFSVVNGSGINRPDNNKYKDFIGKVQYDMKISDIKIEFGGSLAVGKHTQFAYKYLRWGAEYAVDWKRLHLQGELMVGQDQNPTAGQGDIKDWGFLVTAAFDIIPAVKNKNKLRLDLRYDQLKLNTSPTGVSTTKKYSRITAGLTFFWVGQNRFTLNYERVLKDEIHNKGLNFYRDGDDAIMGQFTFVFK